MKKSSFKRWETALMLALCLTFLWGLWAQGEQAELSEKLVRLHVVANSDSPEDQAAKLRLRDEITALLAPALAEARTREEALAILQTRLQDIEALGDVTVSLGTEMFPTRHYESFSLPAGEYVALRVVMGEGRGKNWWCVLFPPLCTEALASEGQETFGLLSEDETALVTRSDEGYVLKFRLVELWGQLAARLSGSWLRRNRS